MKKAHAYENVQIGNFLVSMGYCLRDLGQPLVGSINLLQQTPFDKPIGDVFGALAGRYFVLEFKPDKNRFKTELKKPQRNKLLKELVVNSRLKLIANKGHLIGFPSISNTVELEYNFQPYFETFNGDETIPIIKTTKEFVQKLIDSENDFGCNLDEISTYIKLLNKCADKNDSGSMSGIVICMDNKKGLTSYTFDNILELALSMNIELGISQSKSKNITRSIKKRKSKGRSM